MNGRARGRSILGINPYFLHEANVSNANSNIGLIPDIGSQTSVARRANIKFAPTLVLFIENQVNKSHVKAISEVKKTSAKAFQDIVNIGKLENSSPNDHPKNDLKKASNVPLKEMSAREVKQLADKIVKNEINQEQAHRRDTSWKKHFKRA